MTIKDLQRIVISSSPLTESSKEMQDLQRKLRGRPFYSWDAERHKAALRPQSEVYDDAASTTLLAAGLPKKNGKEYPLFNYEFMVNKVLTEDTYLNARPPIPEEETFRKMKVNLEGTHIIKEG